MHPHPAATAAVFVMASASAFLTSTVRNTNPRVFLSTASSLLSGTSSRLSVNAAVPFVSSPRGLLKSSTRRSMTTEKPTFPTWTFDEPCDTMEWSPVHGAEIDISSETTLGDADLVIVGVFGPEEGSDEGSEKVRLSARAAELDESLGGVLTDVMNENAKSFLYGAKAGALTPTLRLVTMDGDGKPKTKRYVLLGLGKESKQTEGNLLSTIGTSLGTNCDSEKSVRSCALVLPAEVSFSSGGLTELSTGFYSSLHSDDRFRKEPVLKAENLTSVVLYTDDDTSSGSVQEGRDIAAGIATAKDIVNAPHNVLNSVSLANTARKMAEESGGSLTCTVLGKEECEERGMGAYLGVARGSETPPQFIHLVYKPQGEIKRKVGIVGKGLLYDTGGYNIKVAGMELMKFDCGGAAAVLGAARAIGQLKPEGVEAHFIVAACENMINDRAIVPSDIVTASNGKTIEILNTDAEGRLTLADAIVFADKEVGCERIIELSTLTGACMVSLGLNLAGVWTSDDGLAKELEEVSKQTGEKSWRMPLVEEYNEELKSQFADMTNLGGRYGGAITAALFLNKFVDEKKPFAHIDIAGPVWAVKGGATGFGAKMVTEWVKRQGME